jgi:acyl carrier protein
MFFVVYLAGEDIGDEELNFRIVEGVKEENFSGYFRAVPLYSQISILWAKPSRWHIPLFCCWLYGLATGRGVTASILGNHVMVKYLSPASYGMYLMHFELYFSCFFAKDILQGAPAHSMGYFEYFLFNVFCVVVGLFMSHVVNDKATAIFERIFDKVYFCCPCYRCCCELGEVEEGSDSLAKIARAIADLTGSDVTASTPLSECGLDSFGASSLVGVLKARLPGLRLQPRHVYELETVGELARFIDDLYGGDTSSSRVEEYHEPREEAPTQDLMEQGRANAELRTGTARAAG